MDSTGPASTTTPKSDADRHEADVDDALRDLKRSMIRTLKVLIDYDPECRLAGLALADFNATITELRHLRTVQAKVRHVS